MTLNLGSRKPVNEDFAFSIQLMESDIIAKYEAKKLNQKDILLAKASIDRVLKNVPRKYCDNKLTIQVYRRKILQANIKHYKTINSNIARHIVNYCIVIMKNGLSNFDKGVVYG